MLVVSTHMRRVSSRACIAKEKGATASFGELVEQNRPRHAKRGSVVPRHHHRDFGTRDI